MTEKDRKTIAEAIRIAETGSTEAYPRNLNVTFARVLLELADAQRKPEPKGRTLAAINKQLKGLADRPLERLMKLRDIVGSAADDEGEFMDTWRTLEWAYGQLDRTDQFAKAITDSF